MFERFKRDDDTSRRDTAADQRETAANGRTAVAELYRPYGTMIVLDRCHDLAVHHDTKTGVVVIEYVFNYPGIGSALQEAVVNHDLPVVQALAMLIAGVGLFIVKTFMEEAFLAEDPTYAQYMRRVRYRWIPGIA